MFTSKHYATPLIKKTRPRPSNELFALSMRERPTYVDKGVCSITGRMLVIDDDLAILESARMALEDLGLEVEISQGGEELLQQLAADNKRYDLVLCDVTMPVMSGWDMAEALRGQMPDAKIFMVTGWLEEECFDPRRKLVNGILLKPLELNVLEGIVFDHCLSQKKRPLFPIEA